MDSVLENGLRANSLAQLHLAAEELLLRPNSCSRGKARARGPNCDR
jgi:hypothetical protein